MSQNNAVDRGSNVAIAIIFLAVFLAVMLLALVLIVGGVSQAITSTNGEVFTAVAVINETGFANSSGYTVSGASATGFRNPALTALFNRTSGLSVALNNATISSVGVVRNATAVVWNNLSISYTYEYNTTSTSPYNTVLNTGIVTNVLNMVSNFFALMPTVGTILAVVILIGGIVLLVIYVRKMKDKGTSEGSYTG